MDKEQGITEFLNYFFDRLDNITKTEIDEIVIPMYQDGWNQKDIINHITSIRSFNKRNNEK